MKAIILAAGIGSRIRPLTNNCPKSLLKIGDKTILEMMITHIQNCHINEIIFVTGYLENQIKKYIDKNFPDIKTYFVTNKKYAKTNTGVSLLLAKDFVQNSDFIKFDADVIFDKEILEKLIECQYENALCIDKNIHLDEEEIKVIIDNKNNILEASKTVDPQKAIGESIGIEKIGKNTAKLLFQELEAMMEDKNNHQEYYEAAYERLVKKGVSFHALDITGLQWIEIDTKKDFTLAKKYLSKLDSF